MPEKPIYKELEKRIQELEQEVIFLKHTENKLKKSEESYKVLAEHSADVIYKINLETELYTYASPSIETIFGYTVKELLLLKGHDTLTADSYGKQRDKLIEAITNNCMVPKMMELEAVHKDGHILPVEIHANFILDDQGNPVEILGIVRDITKQRAFTETLRRSKEKFKFLAENMGDIVWTLDMDLNATYVSPSVKKVLGYTVEERLQQKMEDTVTLEAFELIMALFLEELEREKKFGIDPDRTINIDVEYVHKNGSIVWMENVIKAIRDESNIMIGMYGVSHNITERKKAQETLAEKNSLLDNILRNARDIAIATTDLDFRINYYNPTAEKLFGYKKQDVVGKTVQEMHSKEKVSDDRVKEAIEQVMRNGEYRFLFEQETDKGKRYIDSCIFSIFDHAGKLAGYSLFCKDVTDQKEAEKILLQASRIESISTLTGGIAHDFNNLLSVVLGNIELAGVEIKTDLVASKFLKNAGKALLQTKKLTRQLIVFSKGGAPFKKLGSIINLITQTTNFVLENTNVKCDFLLPDKLWPVEFDKDQIKQVIKNLIVNAVESMPDGGTIVVKAKNLNPAAKKGLPITTRKHIKVSIQDQGSGISKEYLSTIFDPYFSTKEMGTQKGMGLGLATTYSIINRHDGHLTVESEVGAGSIFTFYLPVYEKDAKELERKEILTPEKSAIKTGKILLMDDEEIIRQLGEQMLKRFGYNAELAKDGAEAIELYKKSLDSGKPFEVVILDLTVKGGMGGQKAMEKILEIDPAAKGIVSTGYFDDPVVSNFREYGFSGFLKKPTTMGEVEKVINEVISNNQ